MISALLDTNVLFDAACEERPRHQVAKKIIELNNSRVIDGCIASLSLKDVYYLVSRFMNEKQARSVVNAYIVCFEIVAVDDLICRMAMESDEPDFEDGLVRAAAERKQCEFILTNDKKAFNTSMVKKATPEDLVALLDPKRI